jgi:hypothetical protein
MVVLVVVWLEPFGAVVVVVDVPGGGGVGAGVVVVVVVDVLPSEFTVVLVEAASAPDDARTSPAAIASNPPRIRDIVERLMRFSFSKGRVNTSDSHGLVRQDVARLSNGIRIGGFRLSLLGTLCFRRLTFRCHRARAAPTTTR